MVGCDDALASNYGAVTGGCVYTFRGTLDNLRLPTGLNRAQARGLDGSGVKVGLLDTEYVPGYAPLGDRVVSYTDLTGAASDTDTSTNNSHGLAMAAMLAGGKTSAFSGGAAPSAEIYWGRVCLESGCSLKTVSDTFKVLADKGVRLFNLSLGAVGSSASAVGNRGLVEPALAVDALVVAATGNRGLSEPDNPAGLPNYYPDAMDNWLAVTNAQVNSSGQVSGLDGSANACGQASQWCLAAPGYLAVPTMPGYSGPSQLVYYNGTSSSTAVVTGTAALVWQAFPWMSAHQVQQTLLTTATDLGDPGVDATFGWGLLNADKAVNGPGALTSAWEVAIPSGQVGTFVNDMGGSGGLSLVGGGTLVLTGNNTYTGGTTLGAGTLAVSGRVSGRVVQQGGTLTGSGVIDGSLVQREGVLALEVGQPLTVSGSARLGGQVSVVAPQDWREGASGVLLQAGSIEGSPAVVDDGVFMRASAQVEGGALVGLVGRASGAQRLAQSGVGDGTTVATASRIDALLAQWDGYQRGEAVLGQVQGLVLSAGGALALDSVAGQAHATSRSMAMSVVQGQQKWVSDRAMEARRSERGGSWVMVGHQARDIRPTDAFAARVRSESVVVGADKALGDWRVGLAAQSGQLRSSFERFGGQVETDQVGASAYATWVPSPDWAVSVNVGGSQLRNEVSRDLVLGGVAQVGSRTKATLWTAGVAVERDLVPGWSVRGGLSHDRLASKGFTEGGEHAFRLRASSSSYHTTYASAAVRWDSHDGGVEGNWTYGVEAGYRYGLRNRGADFRAEYADLPGSVFTVEGAKSGRHYGWLGGRLGYRFTANQHLQLEGDGTDQAHGTDVSANVRYRYDF